MMAVLCGSTHIVGIPSSSHTQAISRLAEKQLEKKGGQDVSSADLAIASNARERQRRHRLPGIQEIGFREMLVTIMLYIIAVLPPLRGSTSFTNNPLACLVPFATGAHVISAYPLVGCHGAGAFQVIVADPAVSPHGTRGI